MKLYLDNCCLNRPFDDQTKDRIRIESEAILIILKRVILDKVKLIGSEVLFLEIEKTPDIIRKSQLIGISKYFSEIIVANESLRKRAKELSLLGFKSYDAFHIACAESAKSDFFLTTDDKIIKTFIRNKTKISIKIQNPIIWLEENL